jgi:multicomponent Na+:H+ antiporter subunit D
MVIFFASHALLACGLFLAAGLLIYRTGAADEGELRGSARHHTAIAALFAAGGLGVAGLPPFGTFLGAAMVKTAARNLGDQWLAWTLAAAAAITGAAVLRFTARVFFGWGAAHQVSDASPGGHAHRYTPASMYLTAAVLILLAVVAGLLPRITGSAQAAAWHMADRVAYAERVLDWLVPPHPEVADYVAPPWQVALGFAGAGAAWLLAALSLMNQRARNVAGGSRGVRSFFRVANSLHRRVIPDDLVWLTFGIAALGCAAILLLR